MKRLIPFFICMGYFCSAIIFIAPLFYLMDYENNTSPNRELLITFIPVATLGYLGVKFFKIKLKPMLYRPSWRSILLGCSVMLLLLVLNPPMIFISDFIKTGIITIPLFSFKFNISLDYFFGILLVPFFEELCNRAIILTYLKRYYNTFISLFISSFIFSLGHGIPHSALPIFVSGMVFGYVFIKSNSLILVTIMHSFFNIFPSLFPFKTLETFETAGIQGIYFSSCLLFITFTIFVLRRLVKQIKLDSIQTP